MKKFSKLFTIFFLLISSLAFSAEKASVQTEITEIDVHGNAYLAVKAKQMVTRGFSASDIVNITAGDFKFTAPIVKDYSDVNTGEFLLRMEPETISLAINLGNFAQTAKAKVGTKVTITLKKQYGYLIDYQTRMLKPSDDRAQFESDEVFANFRPLTKGKIKEGKIFRSYSPIRGDVRSPYAVKLAEKNKVTAVIALGDTLETASANFKAAPYYKKLSDSKKVCYVNMGSSFGGEEFNSKLKQTLLFIAENPGETYLIHGKDGKNRTGYVTAVLLALNGATLEEITDDYMQSYKNLYNVKKNFQQYDLFANTIPFIFTNMNGGKKVTDKNLASVVESYLIKDIGLTKAQIEAVCKNLQ